MNSKVKQQNQVRPPLPKKKRVDAVGNDHRRMWLKDGHTTMLFAEKLTENACRTLINQINTTLIKLGNKPLPNNKFLITR